jgi:hypothetical protein
MRAVIAIAILVGCGPKYTELRVSSKPRHICAQGGARIPLVFYAQGRDVNSVKVDPAPVVAQTSLGVIERKAGALVLVLPEQPLKMIAPMIVTARDPIHRVEGTRDLRPNFRCLQTLDLSDESMTPVHIDAGWLATKRHGRLGLVRVRHDARTHWFLVDPYGDGISIKASGDVEMFVADNELPSKIWIEPRPDAKATVTVVPSPTDALVEAAGGKPDEGHDKREDEEEHDDAFLDDDY